MEAGLKKCIHTARFCALFVVIAATISLPMLFQMGHGTPDPIAVGAVLGLSGIAGILLGIARTEDTLIY